MLTRRQQAIFDYLVAYYQHSNVPLSLSALCKEMGLRSKGSLHKHIQALIENGLVEPLNRKQRGIRLTTPEEVTSDHLPMLGYIAAGQPIEAINQPESIAVPDHLRNNQRPCYVLQVRGDSMIEDGILDGDWVVIEQRSYAKNGEIVVALIDQSEATLKRILQMPDEITLIPANSNMEPMRFAPERIQIQGVVVGQMRQYAHN